MEKKKPLRVEEGTTGRLDVYVKSAASLTRSQVQRLIDNGKVFLNGKTVDAYSIKIKPGDLVEYIEELPREYEVKHEDIPLDVVFEDENLLVINKQAGLVVHPAPGHYEGTLVNAIVGKYIDEKSYLGGGSRLGIVHRLDKDTSGIMVIAKNNDAYEKMTGLFKKRDISKIYLCLAHGEISRGGYISTNIGRDVRDRRKFQAKHSGGKDAQTIFEPKEIFKPATLLKVKILTGRTHQIRVHMNFIKSEVVGDPVYGNAHKDAALVKFLGYDAKSVPDFIPRQMLHANEIEFVHPFTGKSVHFTAGIPADMERLLNMIRQRG